MGAKLTLETRFTSRTDSSEAAQSRMKCITESMSSDSSFGVETPDVKMSVSAPVKGAQVGAEATVPGLKAGISNGQASKDSKYVIF